MKAPWDVKTRAPLVNLFYGTDGEWVMWTPEGFYTSSRNGAKIVGWQINRGPDKTADYVSGEEVRDAFFRPDLVVEKINGDPDRKVRDAAAAFNIEDVVTSGIAPEVKIIKTELREETVTENGIARVAVKVAVTAQIKDKGGGIGRIGWRINGQEIETNFGASALDAQGEIIRNFELTLSDNTVQVTAANSAGKIEAKTELVPQKVDEKALKGVPRLFVLAVGVDAYRDVKRKLRFAVSDAATLSTALVEAVAGTDYYRGKPEVVTLRDDNVTADNLDAAFTNLGAKVRATDVFLFFIAGHGKAINGDYYFVPGSVTAFNDETIKTQGFGKAKWRDWFVKIQAQKSIFIFDTCDSGSVRDVVASLPPTARATEVELETAQQRLKEATGRTLFTASSDQQSAIEGFRNHGVLTYAFLEGLAKAGGDEPLVWLSHLKKYVEDKVRDYSKEMKSCPAVRSQEYCQKPTVLVGENDYALVPRYAAIMKQLNPDGVVISRIATHVVKETTELRQNVRGENAAGQVEEGTEVTLISTDGEWAYVAEDGKPLGYVQQNKLLPLKKKQ